MVVNDYRHCPTPLLQLFHHDRFRLLVGPGPVFTFRGDLMATIKLFRSYDEQVELLKSRGMDVGDSEEAARQLRQVNYYRLSGYWYPFRRMIDGGRADTFYPGTTLADVLALYHFDASLRMATFGALVGDVPVSGGVSHHRAGSACGDYAAFSSGIATSSSVTSRSFMECSLK